MEWIFFAINILLIPALSPLVIGSIRAIKARFQHRRGASIFQPYYNLRKLFGKDEVISEDASWIFLTAPFVIFGATLALAAGVPFISPLFSFLPMSDVLVFAYILAGTTFFIALAGIDVGGAFGGFGGSREVLFSSLAEAGLILSLVAVSFLAGSSALPEIAVMMNGVSGIAIIPLVLAGLAFFIALLTENARYPVDNPATHLELTMVHEAMILEYSGKRLALMEWAAANKLLIFVAVFANIFIPISAPPLLSVSALLIGVAICSIKVIGITVLIATIESVMSKFRIFRVPDFLFTSFVMSLIAILIIVL